MRRGRFVLGLVLVVIGVLLIVTSIAVNGGTSSQAVPAGTQWALKPQALTDVSVVVKWSGAPTGTTAYLVSGNPACTGATGVVAKGSGRSGSFSATLSPGTTYYLYACAASTSVAAQFSYTVSGGVTTIEVVGGVVIFLGLIPLLLAFRRPRPEEGADYVPREKASYTSTGLRRSRSRDSKEPERTIFDEPEDFLAPPRPSRRATAAVHASPLTPPAAPPSPAPHGPATADGRTLRGCASCGKISSVGAGASCPACGAPY